MPEDFDFDLGDPPPRRTHCPHVYGDPDCDCPEAPLEPEPELTCVHSIRGLCAKCQSAYDESPCDYIEYGDHPDGIRRWRELLEEIRYEAARKPNCWPAGMESEIPY